MLLKARRHDPSMETRSKVGMPSIIDANTPADGIPASKKDLRDNLGAAAAELNHGGFADGSSPIHYAAIPTDDRVTSHLAGIDAALGQGGSFLQAGAGAVVRTGQDRAREWISVKDFGAVGDGVSDDTTKIQAAFDYALTIQGGVYFPPGTYVQSATLDLDARVAVWGIGEVILQATRDFPTAVVRKVDSTDYTIPAPQLFVNNEYSPQVRASIRNLHISGGINSATIYAPVGMWVMAGNNGEFTNIVARFHHQYNIVNDAHQNGTWATISGF